MEAFPSEHHFAKEAVMISGVHNNAKPHFEQQQLELQNLYG